MDINIHNIKSVEISNIRAIKDYKKSIFYIRTIIIKNKFGELDTITIYSSDEKSLTMI